MLLFLRRCCPYRLSFQRFHPFVNALFFIHQCKMWFMLSTSMFYGRGNLFEWTSHSMLWLVWRKFVYFFPFSSPHQSVSLSREAHPICDKAARIALVGKRFMYHVYIHFFMKLTCAYTYNSMYCLHQTELALTGTINPGQRLILMCTGPAAATVDLSNQL